jgi:predicted nucleotidyltransferase
MKEKVKQELDNIEKEYNVTIFYACESGSRAWGFESKDSDYDVRFLYFHGIDWYLSVDDHRDVIEKPVDDLLDINGWDLKKALRLLRKSNPPLLEWLQSPIIYKNITTITALFRDLFPKYYSQANCYYHYLHMAQGNFREYLKGDEVWIKKYFYVLRPIMACRWIEEYNKPVPMEFETLVDKTIEDEELKTEIDKLLKRKKEGDELNCAPRVPVISNFIESDIERLEKNKPEKKNQAGCFELNRIFRQIIACKD